MQIAGAEGAGDARKQQILKQQRWLLFLRHCARCQLPEAQCQYGRNCTVAKQLWQHLVNCKEANCEYARCGGRCPLPSLGCPCSAWMPACLCLAIACHPGLPALAWPHQLGQPTPHAPACLRTHAFLPAGATRAGSSCVTTKSAAAPTALFARPSSNTSASSGSWSTTARRVGGVQCGCTAGAAWPQCSAVPGLEVMLWWCTHCCRQNVCTCMEPHSC